MQNINWRNISSNLLEEQISPVSARLDLMVKAQSKALLGTGALISALQVCCLGMRDTPLAATFYRLPCLGAHYRRKALDFREGTLLLTSC